MAQGKGDPSSVSQFSKTKSSNYFFLIKFFETSSEISVCITKLAFKGLFTLTMPLNMQHYVCLYCISENADTAWCLAANYACMPCDLKDTIPKAFINSYYQNLVRTLKKNLEKILSLYQSHKLSLLTIKPHLYPLSCPRTFNIPIKKL